MSSATKLFSTLSATEMADLTQAKSAMSSKYLSRQTNVRGRAITFRAVAAAATANNIVGVGVDEKLVDGVPTGVMAIKFLVRTKLRESALSKQEKLPASIDGMPTDVEEVGMIVPLAAKKAAKKAAAPAAAAMPDPKKRARPAQPGSSVGFREPSDAFVMAGTFGALVKDTAGNLYILSNNHVLAFESGVEPDGTTIRQALSPGAPIFQPGLLDGGKISTDKLAELTRWVDLRADRTDNLVDCAIAKVVLAAQVKREILFIGAPTGTKTAAKDMIVHKFGRTTSYRAGRVSSVLFDLTVPYEVGDVTFTDQIAIRGLNGKRFSDSGDSGSSILERDTNKVVGLLFAGSTNGAFTFANHITDVLTQLKVRLA
ncbi:MAG: hypothetical protein HYR56_12035 [Acidobacteria bacterium]|nr:hypothetical protein [Acidobacteriota bacterium]MBI3422903.1 hypothetical protein [Acidobacteriota bacterium]